MKKSQMSVVSMDINPATLPPYMWEILAMGTGMTGRQLKETMFLPFFSTSDGLMSLVFPLENYWECKLITDNQCEIMRLRTELDNLIWEQEGWTKIINMKDIEGITQFGHAGSQLLIDSFSEFNSELAIIMQDLEGQTPRHDVTQFGDKVSDLIEELKEILDEIEASQNEMQGSFEKAEEHPAFWFVEKLIAKSDAFRTKYMQHWISQLQLSYEQALIERQHDIISTRSQIEALAAEIKDLTSKNPQLKSMGKSSLVCSLEQLKIGMQAAPILSQRGINVEKLGEIHSSALILDNVRRLLEENHLSNSDSCTKDIVSGLLATHAEHAKAKELLVINKRNKGGSLVGLVKELQGKLVAANRKVKRLEDSNGKKKAKKKVAKKKVAKKKAKKTSRRK